MKLGFGACAGQKDLVDPCPLNLLKGGTSCLNIAHMKTSRPFERTSKRRKGYPSETNVKRGHRVVHGDKELVEKLGRKDLCPCGSGALFQAVLFEIRPLRRRQPG